MLSAASSRVSDTSLGGDSPDNGGCRPVRKLGSLLQDMVTLLYGTQRGLPQNNLHARVLGLPCNVDPATHTRLSTTDRQDELTDRLAAHVSRRHNILGELFGDDLQYDQHPPRTRPRVLTIRSQRIVTSSITVASYMHENGSSDPGSRVQVMTACE